MKFEFIASLLAAASLTAGAQPKAVKTYTLLAQTVADAITTTDAAVEDKTTTYKERRYTFTSDGIEWTLTLYPPEGEELHHDWTGDQPFVEAKYENTVSPWGAYNDEGVRISHYTLTTSAFATQPVGSVEFEGAVTNLETGDPETPPLYTLTVGSRTDTVAKPIFMARQIVPVNLAPKVATSGDFTLKVENPKLGLFAFRLMTVTIMDKEQVPTPEEVNNVVAGYTFWLESPDDAPMFWRVKGAAEWNNYDAEAGIVLTELGTQTVEFYAQKDGFDPSLTIEETFDVVKPYASDPSGLEALRAASRAVTVRGVIVGKEDVWVHIGEQAQSRSAVGENVIALNALNYPELQQAEIGDKVEATGRATASHPTGAAALGSLTAVTLNGMELMERGTTDSAMTPMAPTRRSYFDLQGRPAQPGRTAAPRVLVGTDGRKVLVF